MLFYKIDDNGLALELHAFEHRPQIEIDEENVDDPKYISEPIPNDIFVSDEYPAKWTGEEWVATGVEPNPQPHEPTVEERLAQAEELLQTVTMAFTEYVFAQEMNNDV